MSSRIISILNLDTRLSVGISELGDGSVISSPVTSFPLHDMELYNLSIEHTGHPVFQHCICYFGFWHGIGFKHRIRSPDK